MIELKPANSGGYRAFFRTAYLGEIYREVDGYYVWWPAASGGCFSAYSIRAIADKLDELNAEWDKEIRREFYGPSTERTGPNYIPNLTGDPFDEVHK